MSCLGRRIAVLVLAAASGGFLLTAQAAAFSAQSALDTAPIPRSDSVYHHARLERANVQAALVRRGLRPEQAVQRVAALSDAEVVELSQQLDGRLVAIDYQGAVLLVGLVWLMLAALGRDGRVARGGAVMGRPLAVAKRGPGR